MTGGFRSRNGVIFTKAVINADCCNKSTTSISSSKTGDQLAWPLVRQKPTGEMACSGGMSLQFQEWIDYVEGLSVKGLCIDRDLYVAGGI